MIVEIISLKRDNSVECFTRIEKNANMYQFSKNNLTMSIFDL